MPEVSATIPVPWMLTIRKLAKERHELHKDHATSRPLSFDYEVVGLAGEYVFAAKYALMADWTTRPSGDSGVDFQFGDMTIDVKTARKPGNLIVEKGTSPANILVLAGWHQNECRVDLLGWETAEAILVAPTKDFGYGIINHYIQARDLRKMSSLLNLINDWRKPGTIVPLPSGA